MLRIRLQCNERTIGEIRSTEIVQEITIGRSSSCAWRAPSDDGLISSQHAGLARKGRHVWLRDNLSKNGTWFKGKRIEKRKLQAGDRITMGRCVLIVEKDLEKDASQGVPEVLVLTGKLHKERKPITGTQFTIGSDPKSDLLFLDDLISRHHALIERKPDGFWLKDLDSTNGTKVDGVPLHPQQERLLKDGNHVTVAHMEFVFYDGTAPLKQGQALRRLLLMAVVALFAVGGYYGWQLFARDSAVKCVQDALQFRKEGRFDGALAKLDDAVGSRGYKDCQTEAEQLRSQIGSCKRNAALRTDAEKHLQTEDWSAAGRTLGELMQLREESWGWHLGPHEKKRWSNTKRLLDAYLDTRSDLSRPDIPLDNVLDARIQTLAAAIKDMESVKELNTLRKAAGEQLQVMSNQMAAYRQLDDALKGLHVPNPLPDVQKALRAVELVAQGSDGLLRQRAEKLLHPLRPLATAHDYLLKATQSVHERRFEEVLNGTMPLPTSDECNIDERLGMLRANLQSAFEKVLKPKAQEAKGLIETLEKRLKTAGGIPEEFKFWEDPITMEKILSCDSLNGLRRRSMRKEPQGEYDRAVYIEGFHGYLRSIADEQPANYAEDVLFKCMLIESHRTVEAARRAREFFAVPDNRWLKAGQLERWSETSNQILSARGKITDNLLDTARHSSGRKAVVAAGIACRLLDSPEKEKIGDQTLTKWLASQFKSLRREVEALWDRKNAASEAGERIRLRNEILKVGLPGDLHVGEMWSERLDAGTNSPTPTP